METIISLQVSIISKGVAAVAISIFNCSAAIHVLLSSVFLGQVITGGQIVGVVLALVGVTLLTTLIRKAPACTYIKMQLRIQVTGQIYANTGHNMGDNAHMWQRGDIACLFLSNSNECVQRTRTCVELHNQWNCPYFFFLKIHISAPGAQNFSIFLLVQFSRILRFHK